MIGVIVFVLWTPLTAKLMFRLLAATVNDALPAQLSGCAILAPTAGAYTDAIGPFWPAARTVQRVTTALKLKQELGLPLIISGGKAGHSARSEADVIVDVLQLDPGKDLDLWIEPTAVNSYETARKVAQLAAARQIGTVILVTSGAICRAWRRLLGSSICASSCGRFPPRNLEFCRGVTYCRSISI